MLYSCSSRASRRAVSKTTVQPEALSFAPGESTVVSWCAPRIIHSSGQFLPFRSPITFEEVFLSCFESTCTVTEAPAVALRINNAPSSRDVCINGKGTSLGLWSRQSLA